MKVSREQVAENRSRILAAAGRMFRERGFDSVTVAEVMKAAGLTHGGFYGYFASKDELIAASLAELVIGPVTEKLELGPYAAQYLTSHHRDNRAAGCPVAALGAETIRHSAKAREAMTEGLRRQIARLSPGAGTADATASRRAAIGGWATLVGALILARMSDDPDLSDDVLAEARAWIGRDEGS